MSKLTKKPSERGEGKRTRVSAGMSIFRCVLGAAVSLDTWICCMVHTVNAVLCVELAKECTLD